MRAANIETEPTGLNVGQSLKRLREAAGLSVRTLAREAGFSASFVSQVENGQASPSIASLERLARALKVSLGQFFDAAGPAVPVVVRAADRHKMTSLWSRTRIEPLVPAVAERQLEAVMITMEPGGRSSKEPYSHAGEEMAIVFENEVTLVLGDETYELGRGDAVSFRSETPHLWENRGSSPAQFIIVSTRFTH